VTEWGETGPTPGLFTELEAALRRLASTHHTTFVRVGGLRVVARPLRDTSWWHRWKAERVCKRAIGHCWHAEVGSWTDWWCCECSGETDGMPAQGCLICLRFGDGRTLA
jgi:hypothetical protein